MNTLRDIPRRPDDSSPSSSSALKPFTLRNIFPGGLPAGRARPERGVYDLSSIIDESRPKTPSPEETPPSLNPAIGGSDHLPVLNDFFTIGEKIASGGFCDVYSALDKTLLRTVAVKVLDPEKDNRYSLRSAFLTEAKLMAYLDHPGILPIQGIYTDGEGKFYLVLKLIRGRTLRDRLRKTCGIYSAFDKKQIRFSERRQLGERLEIFLKVCDAVAYAHHKGVIHRDLKPANIMLGDFNEVYVMDWGLAEHRNVTTLARTTGVLSGTVPYLAPELLMKKAYDSRSDIFALGAILFELVCLRMAFSAASEEELILKIARGETAPFRHRFDVPVPRGLRGIIRRALAVDPENRYQSVRLFSGDIREYLRGVRTVRGFRIPFF